MGSLAVEFLFSYNYFLNGHYSFKTLKFCSLMLRCRQDSRDKFLKLRKDVMVKLELLDQKHGKQFHSILLQKLSLYFHGVFLSVFKQFHYSSVAKNSDLFLKSAFNRLSKLYKKGSDRY